MPGSTERSRVPLSFDPPAVPAKFVTRERILGILDQTSGSDVVCLKAPGGYGKTTVVAQWAGRDPRAVIWLRVRAAAPDPHWLARGVVDGLRERGLVPDPVPLPGTLDLVSWHLNTLPAVERTVSAVSDPFLVVVDDAQEMSGPLWESLVETLAMSIPPGSQLAMTTRGEVPATLWRLQSRGEVAVLGPEVLAFDLDDSSRMMETVGVRMGPARMRDLVDGVDGWPVAVCLAALSSQRRSTEPSPHVAGIDGLGGYLRHDILGRLSPDDAQFLLHVSVLPVLDAEACDAVTNGSGSLSRLRRLSSVNQLLSPEDPAAEVFRMHPLLSEFLGAELNERDPESWRAAHANASAVCEQRNDLDGAVHHAKQSGDDERLSDLIWSHTGGPLGAGQAAVLERWLDGIDEQRLRGHCGLALSAAWAASHMGDMARMSRLALAAEELSSDHDASHRADAALLRATIGADGITQICSASREFISAKPSEDVWQTLAHFLLGVSLFLGDEDEEATAVLEEGYRLSTAMDLPIMVAHCLAGLADAALARGDEHRALTSIHEMRQLAARFRLDAIATAAPIFTTSAVGYVLEGRLIDAKREAARALRMTSMMRTIAPWHAVQGRLSLARVSLALGDADRARMLLEEAGDARIPAAASSRLDRLYAETRQRLVETSAGLAGDSSLTTAEVRVLQYLPTHLSFPQIADELFVSRHTVKTQAMSAYRKLGVHTRAEAIVTARRAGLLPQR